MKQELLNLNEKGTVDLETVDLSSFSSIKKFSESVLEKYTQIDILINNAGVFSREKAYTEEGFEQASGVNYLGTYYLTELLLPILKQTPKSKIIMISSLGSYYGTLSLNEEIFYKKTNNFRDYFNSKLANLIYSIHLKETYPEITIKAADPGVAYSNIWKWKNGVGRMINVLYRVFFKSAKKASRVILELCENKYDDENFLLYKYRKTLRLPKKAKDKDFNRDFIKLSNKVIKEKI